jgi:streptogramin lyase
VLWQVPVGGVNAVPRALTIDQLGRIWVGLHNEQRFVVIDGETGDQVGSVGGLGSCPYGAVTDSTGRVWASFLGPAITVCGDPGVQWIDGASAAPSDADVGTWYPTPVVGIDQVQPYGVTIDSSDRLFMGDYAMGGVIRFDPATETWDYEDVAAVATGSSGATYHAGTNRVFISHGYSGTNLVTAHDPDTLDLLASYNASTIAGISSAHGLAPDFNGNIWMGARSNSRVGVLDPVAGTIAAIVVPNTTYTYSDFTGYSYAVVVATTGGFYRTYDSSEPCIGPTSFRERIYWTASMPAGASISFFGASADDDADLPSASEVNLGSTSDATGSLPVAATMSAAGEDASLQYFRLRVVLHRGEESPAIERLSLQEYCP